MIKKLLIILILFFAPSVYADTGYVSPETYAVNEADLLDYMEIPSAPKPDIDSLNSNKIFNKSNKIEKAYKVKPQKEKRVRASKKPYEERFVYKVAKWWTDQRYKREEPHHGEKHEIKVNSTYRQEQLKKQQAQVQSEENNIEPSDTDNSKKSKQKKNKKSKKNKNNN
jgi:hypothetical protein